MKTFWKKWLAVTLILALLVPTVVSADAIPGDIIVTLGEDLSEQQRQQLLTEMDVNEDDVLVISVSNEEEHQYLGDYVSAATIGSNALSSSKITIGEEGDGLNVETRNVNWVSEVMFANALITAGVEDAEVYVTAPMSVSGTAGLTGLIKAYEVAADIVIPEEQKQVANEEMVRTAELGESIGVEEATELMNRIKEEIADQPIETEEDLRELIRRLAEELGITLTDEELDGLVSLFMRMKDLNINWDQVQDQISKVRDNLDEFLNREDTQTFIQRFLDMVNRFIDSIRGFFSS